MGKPQILTDRAAVFFPSASFEKWGEAGAKPDAGCGPLASPDSCGLDADGRICLWCDKTSLTRSSFKTSCWAWAWRMR